MRLKVLCFFMFSCITSTYAYDITAITDENLAEIQANVKNIQTDQLASELATNPDLYLIDVRTVGEANLSGGFIKGKNSTIIPRGWLEFRIEEFVPDKNAPIVVYCGTNRRSPLALLALEEIGYTNVRNYENGFIEWKEKGLPITERDKAKQSFLYDVPQKVTANIYSAIGETAPSTYENTGHNNNLSFVITNDGVVVFNGGGSWLLAAELHKEIKTLTDQPVKYVVLENGQGHAALGASYWRELGVPIIAHADAAHEFAMRSQFISEAAQRRLGDKFYNTHIIKPDITFDDQYVLELGGVRMELLDLGPAHSPGDIMMWIPDQKVVISGDMAFHERMLPVFEETNTGGWIETWDAFEALGAEIVIPGHGGPTNMETVTKYTKDYLVYMRNEVQKILDSGGQLTDAYEIDQSQYKELDTYEELHLRNAARIFNEMEFEF